MDNNDNLSGRLLCFASALMSSVLAVRMFLSSPDLLIDERTSALAFVTLMAASFLVGRSLSGRDDRSLACGLLMGMPFGFFFSQASLAPSEAIRSGADRILLLAGLVVLVASCWRWARQKFFKAAV